ncbi:MAG: putative transporter [Bacteroidales bacterium]
MNWFETLIIGSGIAHSILLIAFVVAIGILFGKLKIGGVSLGITWILFIGIILSHFGLLLDPIILKFAKEFGLILFVYSIGLEVGPSFFSSFKSGGITFNILAVGIIGLGVLTTVIIHLVTGTDIATMSGIMSGAVTNTPGLGAAQQTSFEVTGVEEPVIGMAYAVAYPIGVIGVILVIILLKSLFKVDLKKEEISLSKNIDSCKYAKRLGIEVLNPAVVGRTIYEIDHLIDNKFVISRLYHRDGKMEIPASESKIQEGDRILLITSEHDEKTLIAFFGKKIEFSFEQWEKLDIHLVSRRVVITKSNINGKHLGELNLRSHFGINITRVMRSGVNLVATSELQLQLGDRVMVVGNESSIHKVEKFLGNTMSKLNDPNLFPIFIGIFLGVLLGSIPIFIPGISQPVKLGLAGGPLIIAILISAFGPKYKLITYTTISANKMLREVGISLFLAAVGLGAGQGFLEAIVNGGYWWVLYGAIITIVPIFLIALIARYIFKLDYFSIIGIISGSHTNPPALAYSNSYGVSQVAVAYATVYPLAMFLRVLAAQLMFI